jgi:hypothetical protein
MLRLCFCAYMRLSSFLRVSRISATSLLLFDPAQCGAFGSSSNLNLQPFFQSNQRLYSFATSSFFLTLSLPATLHLTGLATLRTRRTRQGVLPVSRYTGGYPTFPSSPWSLNVSTLWARWLRWVLLLFNLGLFRVSLLPLTRPELGLLSSAMGWSTWAGSFVDWTSLTYLTLAEKLKMLAVKRGSLYLLILETPPSPVERRLLANSQLGLLGFSTLEPGNDLMWQSVFTASASPVVQYGLLSVSWALLRWGARDLSLLLG